MSDLFGHSGTSATRPFRDIGNQRSSTAEDKATLCKRLNELLRRVPPFVNGGSVQQVREWKHQHAAMLKQLKAKSTSVPSLISAVNTAEGWFKQ